MRRRGEVTVSVSIFSSCLHAIDRKRSLKKRTQPVFGIDIDMYWTVCRQLVYIYLLRSWDAHAVCIARPHSLAKSERIYCIQRRLQRRESLRSATTVFFLWPTTDGRQKV